MVQYALIVAGGKGLRMGTELPKQFLPIGGKPVLMRTLEAFYDYNAEIRIILVLPHSQQITGGSCAGSTVFHCRMPLQMEGRRGSTP